MTLSELIAGCPNFPHGHVNNEPKRNLILMLRRHRISGETRLDDLQELNGLIARVNALSREPVPPTSGGDAPTGGTPAAMAIAA